jgi:hypothetical protein
VATLIAGQVESRHDETPPPTGQSPNATLGGRGNVTGVITDPTGASLPNAEAVLDHQFHAKSDQNGRYSFIGVLPGTYRVDVSSPGFRSWLSQGVVVRAGHTTVLDVVLGVGMVEESVTVEAAPLKVETMVPQIRAALATYTPRVRDYFPETLFWNPELVTDAHGRASLHFQLADSLTTWRVAVIGSTEDGRIAETTAEIKTFQPFFAELDPPQVLTIGDEIVLPVPIRNYLASDQNVAVEAAAPPSLAIDTSSQRVERVAASSSVNSVLKLRAAATANAAPLRFTARAGNAADAIEKPIAIHPDGERVSRSDSDMLGSSRSLRVEIPASAIVGSIQSEVVLYPSLLGHVTESMEGVLRRPYGCGEQTISSTYPNLLFLRMAKRAGFRDGAIEQRARRNLLSGYQRLLGYRTSEGGFAYWHDQPADAALTAYAIAFLEDSKEEMEVDQGVVDQARVWLERQSAHTAVALGGFALLALARGGPHYEQFVASRVTELARNAAIASEPYGLAALVLAALDAKQTEVARNAAERLRKLAREDRDSAYWTIESYTPFHSWGPAGITETTAIAISALARWRKQTASGPELDRLIDRGVIYLLRAKDEYGIWSSAHTSIQVLGALLDALGPVRESNLGPIEILVNGVSAGMIKPGPGPVKLDVTRLVAAGKSNEVSIRKAQGVMETQFRVSWYEPWKEARKSADLALDVAYSAERASTGDPIHCDVTILGQSRGGGMMIAEIGLPPGAEVDRGILADLVAAHGPSGIDSFEVAPDHVTFYLWPRATTMNFSFAFRPRYPMRAKAAPSVLYDYYNPDARVVVPPVPLVVEDK